MRLSDVVPDFIDPTHVLGGAVPLGFHDHVPSGHGPSGDPGLWVSNNGHQLIAIGLFLGLFNTWFFILVLLLGNPGFLSRATRSGSSTSGDHLGSAWSIRMMVL